MKNLDSLVKLSIIILCLSVTYKVLTFQNSGRYVELDKNSLLDTETGIVTSVSRNKINLHPFKQMNLIKGESRFFLDEEWDNWIKEPNIKINSKKND